MSTHVDVQQSAIETLIESLGELQRRLDPTSGGNYCATCDVPDITLNGNFAEKLQNARTAAQAGKWLEAMETANDLVRQVHALVTNSAGQDPLPELVETYYHRLLFPALLFALKKNNSRFYTPLLVLLWMEQRGREWLSGTSFADRTGFLFANILARSFFHVTRTDAEGTPTDPEFE
jgi:hypothetical protein